MKRYSEYKDSGMKWIGMVPEHWNICRLKYLSTCNDETLAETYPDKNIINYVEIGDVTLSEGIKNSTVYQFGKAPSRARRITRENDVIISTVRTYLQAIATVNRPNLVVSTGFAVIRPTGNQNAEYLSFALKSKNTIDWIVSESTGISYPAITANKLNSVPICTPPLCEQQAIVSYLDGKVAKIDKYIAVAEKKIKALEELKQTIISDAVTHGTNPHVKMKDSDIKWIGMVPEHWSIKKIRNHFTERRVKVSDRDYKPLSVAKIGIVPQLEDACKTNNGDDRKLVMAGDFVVNSRSDRKGSCGVSEFDGSVSLINIVLEPRNIDEKYIHFLFRSNNYIEEFYRNGRGIVADLWTTRYSEMKNIYIPIPPLTEQQAIVSYIDRKVSQIEQLRTKELSQIEKLKEYKQRLISDVVTGKVRVTND